MLAPGALAASGRASADWVGPAPAASSLQLVLPLSADEQGLERFAQEVSTPGSPEYGHYESIAQLAARFGASSSARARVLAYLRRVGGRSVRIDATGLFADVTMRASAAERLFSAPLARFRSARAASYLAPTASARVPAGLRGAVTGVVGLDTAPLASGSLAASADARALAAGGAHKTSARNHSGTSTGCSAGVSAGEEDSDPATAGFTPNQYLSAYGYSQLQSAGFDGQGERAALIEIDGYSPSDIQTFASCFGLSVPPITAHAVGMHHLLAPGGESTLDLEVLDAAAPQLAGVDVYETDANAANTLRALTAPLQNPSLHPQVISASLGLCEPAVAAAVGLSGLRASEGALAMAAANGITFLASSGDSGSADCTTSNGTPLPHLAVNYPSSSPWVTAVGGTNLTLSSTNSILDQVVWNDGSVQPGAAAGGGSSELFLRPFYQKGTVSRNRRAVPDVSMLADIVPGYAFYCSAAGDCVSNQNPDPWQSVGGTSAATPLLAGGIAIVDEQLREHQRHDLGLVNPMLYTIGRSRTLRASVFSDVVQLSNDVGPFIPGGHTLGCCTARAGFDRASGWGSLNLAGFAPAALALAPPIITLSIPAGQHPLRQHVIAATVTCAAACRVGAYAAVSVTGKGSFQADSGVAQLTTAGSVTVHVRFSGGQLARVRWGLAHHRRISATVYGVTVQGRKTISSQTTGQTVPLTG